jgi:V8-like Glu-specific endopeptidase
MMTLGQSLSIGWLIKDDIMVTAGHCAFDWAHKMGRLTHVKAYIGYYGKESIGKTGVQFRQGKRVVTTSEWLTFAERAHDVSCIQLMTPPLSGSTKLGVVGYPGDLKNAGGEPGAEMYKMFLDTDYDLTQSTDRMLQYAIDTYRS